MISIYDGGLVQKDPDSIDVLEMDWAVLPALAEISTSTWVITGPDSGLTKDNDSVVTGNRKTRVRLLGGTLGRVYTVTNRVVTNESPAQTKDRSFKVLVQER